MKRLPFGNRLTPFLLLACALMAVLVAAEWYFATQTRISDPAESRPGSDNAVPLTRMTYKAPPIGMFDEILERPLFSEGRQPPAEPATSEKPVAKGPPVRLQLEGVVITPESRIVVVRDLGNNQLLQLAEGMSHQGWTVERVQSAGATFTRGEERLELALEPDKEIRTNNGMPAGLLPGLRP
ncbi:MAG: hypothetical protein WBQ78_01005 [Gammaproteobacteria bacterium]